MKILRTIVLSMIVIALHSCGEPDDVTTLNVNINNKYPEQIDTNSDMKSGFIMFEEINSGLSYTYRLPLTGIIDLPVGVYNINGEMSIDANGHKLNMRTTKYQYTLTSDDEISLEWYLYNPENTFVFGEIYFTGSLNAKGTGGLYDTYLTIYNNTDDVLYADGLAIAESKLHNATTDLILTPENRRDINFTAQAIYVIPGSGKDFPVRPGEFIKIVDQAIDWSELVPGALNHTDADFEWYDVSTSASIVDTDNPEVPNLDKWFCYTLTIWLPSNQCNRSYALVRFPDDMTIERFLVEQKGDYDYINAATGIQMRAEKSYLIKPEWIIDGVNLCPTEKFTESVLPISIDRGYAPISNKNADVNRFGKKFVRKVSGESGLGTKILQDTDNSADDFLVVPVK